MTTQDNSTLQWYPTDLSKKIELAVYQGYRDTNPVPMLGTYFSFFQTLLQPDPDNHSKSEGQCFLIGPCHGRRLKANVPSAFVAVIDADQSIGETGLPVEGAPPPLQVHDILKTYNISHILYTTYSHGEKGNRYRIVLPAQLENVFQLRALVTYIVEIVQTQGKIPLFLSPESYAWGQGWAYPRIANEDADFVSYFHHGFMPDPKALDAIYQFSTIEANKAPRDNPGLKLGNSPIRIFDKIMPITWQLESAGYTFVSQSITSDQEGRAVTALRYRKPGSDSSPGVMVYKNQDNEWRLYSFHQNDVLNNGHSLDAYAVYKLLGGFESDTDALLAALPEIQDSIHEEMNSEYPSILDAGVKFKYGNTYVDEFGALTYRFMDAQAFASAQSNQPGVPIEGIDKQGNKVIRVTNRADYWRGCPERVLYNGTVYQPTSLNDNYQLTIEKHEKPYFNLFRNWNIAPLRGSYPLLDWHLRYVICGGSEEQYEWLCNWFAHLFQLPGEKPGVAIVLQGGRGWGKSILFSELARKLGSHAFVAGNNKLLVGNFNAHLRNRLLLVVEESFWAGSHRDKGILQHLVTDSVTGFERKGVDPEAGISYIRVVMISNELWVAPAASDERRYFLPTVTDWGKVNDVGPDGRKGLYFPRLLTEMRAGGLEAFVYDMSRRRLESNLVRTVPETEQLLQQKELSLDWLEVWLQDVLLQRRIKSANKGIAIWTSAGCSVTYDAVQESLSAAAPTSLSSQDRGVMRHFFQRMNQIFGKGSVDRIQDLGDLRLKLGPVEQYQRTFRKHVGFEIDWGKAPNEATEISGDSTYGYTSTAVRPH